MSIQQINNQIKELEAERNKIKKQMVEDSIAEFAKSLFEENSREAMSEREFKSILRNFAHRLEETLS